MLQLPTGGGKTVIGGVLLAHWLADNRKAVWLTHRKELAEQTRGMLTDAGVSARTNIRWPPGTDAPAMAGGVVILMAQTVGRRTDKRQVWNRYNPDDLMVIDEAHHATADLQAHDPPFLCSARVLLPVVERRIAGGAVDHGLGDYTEAGIAQANRDDPDVMTAGALAFWRQHAINRPTIAYAVSVDHAHNLVSVFNDAGVRAVVILGDTERRARDWAIAGFRDGSVKVLVNVVVATEGFDLPDASCVIIARPTLSLALYLQMVGRGLRPKSDRGDCLILDLAANALTHGLPEKRQEWSLAARGAPALGAPPVVWCPTSWCGVASPAASHHCLGCGHAFGKDCNRCGRWRAHKRWQYEGHCGDGHARVCDLCHIDAHIRAHLPIAPPLDELVGQHDPEDAMTLSSDVEIDDELASRLSALFKELLEAERQSIAGASDARRNELRRWISQRQSALNDDDELESLFGEYIGALPDPPNRVQERRIFGEWEGNLRSELVRWQDELNELENRPVDKRAIFTSSRDKAMHLLNSQAHEADLMPDMVGDDQQYGSDVSRLPECGQPRSTTARGATLLKPRIAGSLTDLVDAGDGRWERVKATRSQTHQSWSNIRKAVRALQGREHEAFGTPNVENSAKSCVRKIQREAGLSLAQIEDLLDDNGL